MFIQIRRMSSGSQNNLAASEQSLLWQRYVDRNRQGNGHQKDGCGSSDPLHSIPDTKIGTGTRLVTHIIKSVEYDKTPDLLIIIILHLFICARVHVPQHTV